MTAVEIVGNLYIRNQILEEQFNQAAQANHQLTERLKNITGKAAAITIAGVVAGKSELTDDEFVALIEKALNEPALGFVPPEAADDAEVPEVAAKLAELGGPAFAKTEYQVPPHVGETVVLQPEQHAEYVAPKQAEGA